jgi:LPS-assembly protein
LPVDTFQSMRSRLQLVITAVVLCHLFRGVPLVISQALPDDQSDQKTAPVSGQSSSQVQFSATEGEPLTISAIHQEQQGNLVTLQGSAEIHFRGYILRADTITYDKPSGNATAEGNVTLDGGPHDVHITASHGTYNVRTRMGTFYDAKGTTGAHFRGINVTLTSTSPVAFTGKIIEKAGESEYVIHHGTVTSCELPHPKWTFSGAKIIVEIGNVAHIYHTIFWLRGIPVIYLPYAAPPAEKVGRQTGFLLPAVSNSSTKGFIFGDAFYWSINRSMDTTVGSEYFSKRGWSLRDSFRARPSETSYVNFDYFGVEDRLDQGGEEIKLNANQLFGDEFRGVASIDYLSSYVFRLAFASTFTQAVNSEADSIGFLSKTYQTVSVNAFASRYENFESTAAGDVITIYHAPGFDVSSVDQRLGGSPLFWSYDAEAAGLRRTEPTFDTPNLTGRFDLEPDISLPVFMAGWTLRPEIAFRNTFYTESQEPGPGVGTAVEAAVDRRSFETAVELRPPTLGKVFDRTIAGRKIKHTLEPYAIYRYTTGINNFPSILRFDYRDILSDTNEVEYGLTQRLYFKHVQEKCNAGKTEASKGDGDADELEKSTQSSCTPAGANEFVTWVLKQKYFLNPTFGGAVVDGGRNVLTTTVDFAGIAFLTDPRRFAPIVSFLRMRTTAHTDMQWELDYDTTLGRINASLFFANFHVGDYFFGASQAYFLDPGDRFITPPVPGVLPGLPGPSQFNQFRLLAGYGNPSKRGLSAAAQVSYDTNRDFIQYGAIQTSYNWDCCGLTLEYRRFALGQVRNENAFGFAFTLSNIGTFGNIKRQERLF